MSISLILLVSCGLSRPPVQTPTRGVSASSSTMPTDQVAPTPTETVTTLPTATPPIDMSQVFCDVVEVEPRPLGPEIEVPGNLIGIRKEVDLDDVVLILNQMVRTVELTGTGEPILDWIGISPNGRMLAYAIALEEPVLELTILDPTFQKRIVEVDLEGEGFAEPGEATSWGIRDLRWINDRWMIADLYDRKDPSGHTIRVAMIDSVNGTAIAVPLDPAPKLSSLSSVIFSPDMKRALYVSEKEALVIVDVDTGKILWREEQGASIGMIWSAFGWDSPAAWSPDGSMVAYTAHEEPSPHLRPAEQYGVFIIDRDGDGNHPVTAFSMIGSEVFGANGLVWSPDGKKLAFIAHYIQNQEGSYPPFLFEYDAEEKQLRCVARLMGDGPDFARMLWAPDGRYISYVTITDNWRDDSWHRDGRWFIVDVNSGTTYEVDSEIFQVAGWSSEFAP